MSGVSRSTDRIDLFGIDPGGHVVTAGIPPDSGWQGWWPVASPDVPAGAPASAVSGTTDRLDIVVAGDGADGRGGQVGPRLGGTTSPAGESGGRSGSSSRGSSSVSWPPTTNGFGPPPGRRMAVTGMAGWMFCPTG